jgi:hypothetical protein
MARGWESKSVESQIESAHSDRPAEKKPPEDAESADARRRKDTLLLARKRVMDQIQSASDSRYRELMERTLADLDRLLEQAN